MKSSFSNENPFLKVKSSPKNKNIPYVIMNDEAQSDESNVDSNDEQGTLNIEYDLDHQTSLYLLIILLTGRSELLISEDFRESYLCYRYPLEFAPTRSKVQENWDSKLCADNTSTLNLFYPIAVGNIYSHLLRNISTKVLEEVKQKASEALKAINKKRKTRLTFNNKCFY